MGEGCVDVVRTRCNVFLRVARGGPGYEHDGGASACLHAKSVSVNIMYPE